MDPRSNLLACRMNRLSWFAAPLLAGCAAVATGRDLDIYTKNTGQRTLVQARVELNEDEATPRAYLDPKLWSSTSGFTGKLSKVVTVSWRYKGDEATAPSHEVKVPLPKPPKVRRGEQLELWIDIDGETAVARYDVTR